jgi:hypothetical protein
MECFEFVCHAPSEYFKCKSSPYPTKTLVPEIGFISADIGPSGIQKVPSRDELYGLTEERVLHVTGRRERRKDANIDKKDVKKEKKKLGFRGRPRL